MPKNVFPKHSFTYDGARLNVYHVEKGEGLSRHIHEFTHATVCCSGTLKVTKEGIELLMTKDTQPVNLKAREWHELEAMEDGTVFINVFASEFMESEYCKTLIK